MTETLITASEDTQVASEEQQTTATETPVAEQQVEQQQDAATEEAVNPNLGAPEAYEFKNPEGRDIDPGVLEAYAEVAKELDLSQEAAQKVIDKMADRMAESHMARIEAVQKQWADASAVDKEFGGDKLNENLAVAKKALDQFGTPELNTLLKESGMGNHPEIIRAFYRAGKAISEDRFVGGNASPQSMKSLADRLYSNS